MSKDGVARLCEVRVWEVRVALPAVFFSKRAAGACERTPEARKGLGAPRCPRSGLALLVEGLVGSVHTPKALGGPRAAKGLEASGCQEALALRGPPEVTLGGLKAHSCPRACNPPQGRRAPPKWQAARAARREGLLQSSRRPQRSKAATPPKPGPPRA